MSRKRRILILTEAQHAVIVRAMLYVRDSNDIGQGDGDVSNQWASSNSLVLARLDRKFKPAWIQAEEGTHP